MGSEDKKQEDLLIDEYSNLRQEMIANFERIHDTTKWITGGFFLFLGAMWQYPNLFPPYASLFLLFAVGLLGLSCLRLYQGIYTLGSYVAVVIECRSNAKWHIMSRCYGDYKKKKGIIPKLADHLPFPFGKAWGGDSSQLSILVIGLNLFAFFIAINLLHDNTTFAVAVLAFLFNLYVFYKLFYDMRFFMQNNQKEWIQYRKDFKNMFDCENFEFKN